MKSFLTLCCFLITFGTIAQNDGNADDSTLESIEDLAFMTGVWKGDGWIIINRERKEFTQTEIVKPKAKNSILVVDGLGYAKDSTNTQKRVIHDAFGVISYNNDMESLTMLSYASTGGKMENQLKRTGDKTLEWSFKDERGGTIRFREDFSTKNVWNEIGEYSFDGKKWFPFFQMTLHKQEE